MEPYPADTLDQFAGQVFGILALILLGLGLYWIVWFFINKYLLQPFIRKSFRNETFEKDQKSKD